jgi:hypothetical protein
LMLENFMLNMHGFMVMRHYGAQLQWRILMLVQHLMFLHSTLRWVSRESIMYAKPDYTTFCWWNGNFLVVCTPRLEKWQLKVSLRNENNDDRQKTF